MKRLLPLAAGLLITMSASSVPALKRPFTVTQPDGTTITLITNGDEFHHYITTEDGIPVKRCDDKFYRYVNNDGFTVSNIIARNPQERTSRDLAFLKSTDKEGIKKVYAAFHESKSRKVNEERVNVFKSIKEGEVANALVLLVEFADNSFSNSKEELDNMLNQDGYNKYGSIGSAKEYFLAQSNGKFTMDFNVVGPIKLSKELAYYGENDEYGNDFRVPKMVEEICELAAEQGVDFSKFDKDNDKVVDLVYFVYAGYGENAAGEDQNPELIWPHAHSLKKENMNTVINGYTIDKYACSAELNDNPTLNPEKKPCGIGTFCHEFSHTLGLPDWYNTASGESVIREWSLMDYGSYNNNSYVPVGYSAYEKEFVGWMTIEELTEASTIVLEPLVDSNKAYRITNQDNSDEYIILENRIKKGWDQYIQAEGLMATAVSYDKAAWEENRPNNYEWRYRILPADNTNGINSSYGDLYPYGGNNKISEFSTPQAKTVSGKIIGKPVSGITKNTDNTVSFKFMGGEGYERKNIVAKEATYVQEDRFMANWEAVPNVTRYTLYVSQIINGEKVNTTEYNVSKTSNTIRNLETNCEYSYYVIGIDDETDMQTNPSNEIKVTLGTVDLKESYEDTANVYFAAGNIQIDSAAGSNIEIYDITGCLIFNGKTDEGTTSVKLDKNGMYFVKVNDKVTKVNVR